MVKEGVTGIPESGDRAGGSWKRSTEQTVQFCQVLTLEVRIQD